jgi:hypothetical protein
VENLHCDVRSVIGRQTSIVLEIGHVDVSLEVVRLGIADIRAIEKGAQEEQCEHREDPRRAISCIPRVRGDRAHLKSSFRRIRRVRAARS